MEKIKEIPAWNNLFMTCFEEQAIDRIRRFAKLSESMGYSVALGFSGGKDSQVCYDLCVRAGINFTAYFNRSFESRTTLDFIKKHYPNVIWRHDHNYGYIENIRVCHNGFLPTVETAYCCKDYKHNPKYADASSIVGVRKAESAKRKESTPIEIKNKRTQKRHSEIINKYFEDYCQRTGATSVIVLKPIVDWSDSDIWAYIKRHNLPVNPEYKETTRVGCIVCPKANFLSNVKSLMKYPKLINAFIMAREKGGSNIDWIITSDGIDYENDKCYYICRWLNHSFRPFTNTQLVKYLQFREVYDNM